MSYNVHPVTRSDSCWGVRATLELMWSYNITGGIVIVIVGLGVACHHLMVRS